MKVETKHMCTLVFIRSPSYGIRADVQTCEHMKYFLALKEKGITLLSGNCMEITMLSSISQSLKEVVWVSP